VLQAGNVLHVATEATDSDGRIASVEHFEAPVPGGLAAAPPYQLT